MNEENENSFDLDSAVDSIGADLFGSSNDETVIDNEHDEVNTDGLQQEQETETTQEVTQEEQPPEVTAKAPPSSWAKEHHESWAQIPQAAQDYIELREKQMLDGIEQYKQGHAFGNEVARAVEPFLDMLQAHGVNEIEAISNLMQWNQTLQTGNLEQRQQAFIALGTNLGLIPQEGQQQIDPRTQELQQRLDRIENQAYQQNYQRIASEIESFANDPKNEYFEEVADDLILMMKSEPKLDLKTAYDRAVWANPITRAKESAKLVDQKTKELTARATAEAKAAQKAAGTNVRPVNNSRSAEAPTGSWDDTMQQVLEKRRAK